MTLEKKDKWTIQYLKMKYLIKWLLSIIHPKAFFHH